MKPKPESTEPRLAEVLKSLRKQLNKPLFVPPTRRIIPMRHRSLGAMISGEATPGLPSGAYIEILGQAHSGKTSLTFAFMDAIINQAEGATHPVLTPDGIVQRPVPRKVLFIDSEQAVDIAYLSRAVTNARILEVDSTGKMVNADDANVWVHQPDTLEEAGDMLIQLVATGEFGLVVVDSVAAMLPEHERAKSMSERTVGELARAMSKFFRVTAPIVRKYGLVVALVNQWRDKIGVAFGDPRTAPGGKASTFYDSIKLDVSGPHRSSFFTSGKVVRVKAMKNKITGHKTSCEYELETGWGISAEVEALRVAGLAGVVKFSGMGRAVYAKATSGKKEWVRKWATFEDYMNAARSRPEIVARLWRAAERQGITSLSVAGSGTMED